MICHDAELPHPGVDVSGQPRGAFSKALVAPDTAEIANLPQRTYFGKHVYSPLFHVEVPILAHPAAVQTLPAFVYLIPAVSFFGIGMVPGVLASVIFAMPPTVRMTSLGIRQVPEDLIEAADSFGSTSWQKLIGLQLPMAKTTIMSGVNQTMMLGLSMVVIASMIGALGLGTQVYFAVGRNDAGAGFAAGIAVVIVAIILDRITQSFNQTSR